jgi:UPF0755 protein
MPQHDPTDPFEPGLSPRRGEGGVDDDEDFWGRSRRTRKDDRRGRRGRRRDTPTETSRVAEPAPAPPPRRPEPRARRDVPPPVAPPPAAPPPADLPPRRPPRAGTPPPSEVIPGPVGTPGRSSRATPWASSSRRAATTTSPAISARLAGAGGTSAQGPARAPGTGTMPGGASSRLGTGRVPAVPGRRTGSAPDTGRVPQVRGAPGTGQVPRVRGAPDTGRVPQVRGTPGTGQVPVERGIQGAGPRVTRRNRSVARSTGWGDTPSPGLPGPSGRQAALPAAGRTGAVPAEGGALYDRLDGLAARATPPGGHRVPPSTDLAPAVSPSEVAHEAMGAYEDTYAPETYDDSYGDEMDDEYGPDRSTRRGCGRLGLVMLVVAALLCTSLIGGGVWVRRQINPGGSPGDDVTFNVREGQSTGDIGQTLEDKGVITSASVWTWYVRFRGGGHIRAGEYTLQENMSMGEALDALTGDAAPADGRRVTIPEGLTIAQMKERLLDPENGVQGFTVEGLDAALQDPALRSRFLPPEQQSLEGTLFPETYSLSEDATEAELVGHMVEEFDAVMGELGVEAGAAALGRSVYDVLIVASLVEEEARVPEERPQVARVIYNRLSQDHPLQIDATSCFEKGEVPCQLTASDLESESPYNTRHDPGLPPTPIAAPSRESLDAALHPAAGDWLYYVLDPNVDPNGERHLFTASEEEFIQAKQRCQEAGFGCG